MKRIRLPDGASERYRKLEALGRMLDGRLYDDLPFSFETERESGRGHVPLRERRPSVDFNLAYEITQDTLTELFGDEQFPVVGAMIERSIDDGASHEIASLVDSFELPLVACEAYEEGVVGSVGVVIHSSGSGRPYYEVLPGKYCEPIYHGQYSSDLLAMVITYPIGIEELKRRFPDLAKQRDYQSDEVFWYRYVVGPISFVDYLPLPDSKYSKLGELGLDGKPIEFQEADVPRAHGFDGRVPAVYVRNLGGKGRDLDGMALWWPIRNICVEIDYTLSQAGRGLRYAADPMLFVKRGDINLSGVLGSAPPAGGMATVSSGGQMVRGVTQTLVGDQGSDAKLLEISAAGIKEEREFVSDLREYALEVLGGVRARAEYASGPVTGRAIDKNLRPLRRLVRRQRRPYGSMVSRLIELTMYGIRIGALSPSEYADLNKVPLGARLVLDWPTDETLQGQDLHQHIAGLQLAAGGSEKEPVQLLSPESVSAKLAADIGMHEPIEAVRGDLKKSVQKPAITTQ